jgi:hypothetical protein
MTMRIHVGQSDTLLVDAVSRYTIPDRTELAEASVIALVGPSMRVVVAGRPQQMLVRFSDTGTRVDRLSSAVGGGSLYGSSTVGSVPGPDSTTTVAWLDTGRQEGRLSLREGALDPTAYGGDIRMCLIDARGNYVRRPHSDSTIRTEAQAVSLGSLGGKRFIVWPEARGFIFGDPRPASLCLSSLP